MATMDVDDNPLTDAGNAYDHDQHDHTLKIAPSALQSRILQSASLQQQHHDDDTDDDLNNHQMEEEDAAAAVEQPQFTKLSAMQASAALGKKSQYRRIRCPPHRYTPLRDHWEQILTPLVEYLKLQVR